MKRVILKSNVVYAESSERAKCSEIDEIYFETLTEKEQETYRVSYEPIGNQKYQLVATYESEEGKKLEETQNKLAEIQEEHTTAIKNLSDIISYFKNENDALKMENERIKDELNKGGILNE